MKIPEDNKREIIEGLLPLLNPNATEEKEEIIQKTGQELIALHGIYKTHDGAQVLPGVIYNLSITITEKVNHAQRIGHIIADSNTREEWEKRLAEHLFKYAIDPAKVIQSIPANLSILNIPKNDN